MNAADLLFLNMFEAITKKLDAIENISIKDLFHALFMDEEFRKLIVRLNTEGEQTSQLIYGVNSKDESLDDIGGEYSPYTVMIKKEKGQITDHVTLKDTGAFYKSFNTFWLNGGNGTIQITADTIKEGGVDLIERWGKDIIGLDEQNIGVLRDFARTKIKQIVLKKLAA